MSRPASGTCDDGIARYLRLTRVDNLLPVKGPHAEAASVPARDADRSGADTGADQFLTFQHHPQPMIATFGMQDMQYLCHSRELA